MSAGRIRHGRAPLLARRPLPRPPRGRPRARPPSRRRPDPERQAVSTRCGIPRRTRSRRHLCFDETQHGIERIARRPPLALQAAEQRVDRTLANNRETAGAEPLRHLVAISGPLLHHRQKAEVEHPAKQLATAALTYCHAPHGSMLLPCTASQRLWTPNATKPKARSRVAAARSAAAECAGKSPPPEPREGARATGASWRRRESNPRPRTHRT